jgi:hypothetical protein
MIEYNTQTDQRPGQQPDTLRPAVPAAIRNAARVMYAGAAASVVHFVVVLVATGPTKNAIEHKHPQLSASALSTVTDITVVTGAVAALIGVAAFIWIARLCLRGRNWARITAAVLAGLGVLAAVYDPSAGRAAADLVMTFVVAAIGVVTVWLLWQRSSNDYFRYFKRPEF